MRKKPEYTYDHMKTRDGVAFEEQLRRYQSAGIEITFANASLSLEDIVRICTVREKGAYMCDFVADDENHIVRIDVNSVAEDRCDTVWDGVLADRGKDGM